MRMGARCLDQPPVTGLAAAPSRSLSQRSAGTQREFVGFADASLPQGSPVESRSPARSGRRDRLTGDKPWAPASCMGDVTAATYGCVGIPSRSSSLATRLGSPRRALSRRGWFWHGCNDETTMCQCQPLRQLPCRLVRRRSIKRHHRRRHARQPPELRAPSVADGRYLDLVRAPADSLFEAMNVHVVFVREELFEEHRTASILRGRDIRSSEADHEGGGTPSLQRFTRDPFEEIFAVSGSPQDLHGWCTGFPHRAKFRGFLTGSRGVESALTDPCA